MAKKKPPREEPDEGIDSPPYPHMPTANSLYEQLVKLRDWVMRSRPELNRSAGQEVVPSVREFPDRAAYLAQPIPRQMQHINYMQTLRKQWDHLLCLYEGAWNCTSCVQQKAMMVQSAAIILNDAFTQEETREARANKIKEDMQRAFEERMEAFNQFLEYRGYGKKGKDEEEG